MKNSYLILFSFFAFSIFPAKAHAPLSHPSQREDVEKAEPIHTDISFAEDTTAFALELTDLVPSNNRSISTPAAQRVTAQLGVTLLSRMLWHGYQVGTNPAISPFAFINYRNFKFEINGTMVGANDYAEANLNFYYTLGGFQAALLNYIIFDAEQGKGHVVRFNRSNTPHVGDLQLNYVLSSIPLNFMVSTLVWGGDYKPGTTTNRYSTYLRAGYTFSIDNISAEPYLAATPAAGAYDPNGGNLTNIGVVFAGLIPLSSTFQLPLTAEFSYNTVLDKLFFAATLRFNVLP